MRSCIKSVSALVVMMSMCILSSEIKAAPAKATEPLGTVMDVVSRIEKLQTLSKAIKVADMAESAN